MGQAGPPGENRWVVMTFFIGKPVRKLDDVFGAQAKGVKHWRKGYYTNELA